MSVKVTLDAQAIKSLDEAVKRSAGLSIEALKTEVISAQVMPFNTGTMQNTDTFTDVKDEGDKIIAALITGSPQARRLYFHPEYNFQKINNQNAGGEWLEQWINGGENDYAEEKFCEFMKREAGV